MDQSVGYLAGKHQSFLPTGGLCSTSMWCSNCTIIAFETEKVHPNFAPPYLIQI